MRMIREDYRRKQPLVLVAPIVFALSISLACETVVGKDRLLRALQGAWAKGVTRNVVRPPVQNYHCRKGRANFWRAGASPYGLVM